jgi:hypothetical protein
MQLSPGSKLLQLGPEKGVEPVLSLLQHACDSDTPAHLRSRFASDFNAFIKQWQVAYEADSVASAEHVQALQKVSSPLTVHRARSAGERHRRKKYPVPGVHSFTKTSKEFAAETEKPPATISGRLDRLASRINDRPQQQQQQQVHKLHQQQNLRNPLVPPAIQEEPLEPLRSVMLENDRRRLAAA